MNRLVLIRGLPGSGKSTLAKCMTDFKHLETDMFWGTDYNFDITRIKEAHQWCQNLTAMRLRNYNVVVSNTFTTRKEIEPYLNIAKEYGIVPQIITCEGSFRNIHNVPEEVIEKMKARFEYNILGN